MLGRVDHRLAYGLQQSPHRLVDRGVTDGHHELSHHRMHQEKVDKLKQIDQFLVSQFAYFLEQLKSVKEGEGTLLDHSLILYGSGISDGTAAAPLRVEMAAPSSSSPGSQEAVPCTCRRIGFRFTVVIGVSSA